MSDGQGSGWLGRLGGTVLDNGYEIIPILPRKKRPKEDNWTVIPSSKASLRTWLKEGQGSWGIGIRCRNNPAADLDIQNQAVVDHMLAWIEEHIGLGHARIGRAPKTLLAYRTDEPFSKVTSARYYDPDDLMFDPNDIIGCSSRIEVLGDGQQYVAYHTHPQTKKPYRWPQENGPADVASADLPLLTREQAIAIKHEFERYCEEIGWTKVLGNGLNQMRVNGSRLNGHKVDHDDPFISDAQKTDISDEELERKLMLIPGCEDYDTWLQIGMALCHQYDGNDRGLALWHQWSEPANNYDRGALDYRWEEGSFDAEGKKRQPTTARTIIALAQEFEKEAAKELVAEFTRELKEASSLAVLMEVAEKIKKTEIPQRIFREKLANLIKIRSKEIDGTIIGISMARDLIKFEDPDKNQAPAWMENWVFVSDDEIVLNTNNGLILKPSGFNLMHMHYLMTRQEVLEGKSKPEQLPLDLGLSSKLIPTVGKRVYMPNEDDLFSLNGVPCVNTFSSRDIPATPDVLSKKERAAIVRVERHFANLIPDERDRAIFISHNAYVVQTMKRVNWATFIQGVEGDGKSTISKIMSLVLGVNNVFTINAKALESDFTEFAEGNLMVFVAEVKMHGHNRFDVMNGIKTFITDDVVEVHPKHFRRHKAINQTTYCLMSNFRDAMPIAAHDRRYYTVQSAFQNKDQIVAFERDNPSYFDHLHEAIESYPGAVRKWLMEYELHPEFKPQGRAPDNSTKDYLIRLTKSPELEAIEEIISESERIDLSSLLLDTTLLADEFNGTDVQIPQTNKLASILSEAGFTYLGRIKVNGEPRRYWSRKPHLFTSDGVISNEQVRRWVNHRL